MASAMALVKPAGELHMEVEEGVEEDLAVVDLVVLEPVVLVEDEAEEAEEEAVGEAALEEAEVVLVEINENSLETPCASQAGIHFL